MDGDGNGNGDGGDDMDYYKKANNDGLGLTLSPLTSRFSIPGLPWVIHTFYTICH